MKLVIFGLTISSSWGNGHATLWRALCHALIRAGHDVVFFERDMPYYAANRDVWELPGGALVLYPEWSEARALARRHLAEADVAMTTSYCPDALAAAALAREVCPGLCVFYDLDTPVTLARIEAGERVDYLGPEGLSDFDLVLSYTGGGALVALRERLGARRVTPLYGSVDPDIHRPVAPQPHYRADLSYLGTYAADRQDKLEALFIAPARRLPHRRFVLGGAQYPQSFPWTDNIHFVRHLPPPEHPAFFSSARLTLNITRRAMAEMGFCPSGRLFEAAACGTPIVSDWWEGLDAFFAPDSEILIARDSAAAEAAIEAGDSALAAIGRAARARVLDAHTAAHRARDLEAALEAAWSGRPLPAGERAAGEQAAGEELRAP